MSELSIVESIKQDYEKILDARRNEIERLQDMDKILRNENINLKLRINKAIEYIEEHNIIGTNKEYLPSGIEKCYSLELMEILKGSDKKMIEIKDIAQYEDNDSELAKYTIATIEEENKRLHSIIKEVREYITNQRLHKFGDTTGGLTYEERKLLEILDKEKV